MVCRTTRPKRELLRVARSREGLPILDAAYREPGRGAYICRTGDCWDWALSRGALGRALALRTEDLATLRGELEEAVKR